jgi:hypothetical protein
MSVGLLLGLLALGAQPAQAQLTGLGEDVATLELDVPEAPTADNITITDSMAAPAGGRKLLQTQFLIRGGGPNGGYVACNYGKAAVLLCYGTPDKHKASKFVAYGYKGMYQLQLAGSTYCLTIFSKPQNQVRAGFRRALKQPSKQSGASAMLPLALTACVGRT